MAASHNGIISDYIQYKIQINTKHEDKGGAVVVAGSGVAPGAVVVPGHLSF